MLKNFFIIAYRNLYRQKIFSLINISGLALGLTCSLIISLWINDEISMDKFHKNGENIYQIMFNMHYPGGEISTWQTAPYPLQEILEKEYPEIEKAALVTETTPGLFSTGEESYKEKGIYAGKDFFQIFSFPLIHGNAAKALSEKYNVVISEKFAKKLSKGAPVENLIGTTIQFNQKSEHKIAGIAENPPTTSTIQFDYILTFDFNLETRPWNKEWGNYNNPMYVLLKENTDISTFNKKIESIIKKHRGDEELDNHAFVYPFEKLYLTGNFENGEIAGGRIEYISIFSVVALMVLILACINFMNLATARAAQRAREVGIKKAIGAGRKSLVFQFLGESLFITFLAMVLAVALTSLLLPIFNELTQKALSLQLLDAKYWIAGFVIWAVTGIFSGSYPAFFISGYQPVKVLKGSGSQKSGAGHLRKGLVVLQFFLSIVMIIGTLVVYQQVVFIMNRNLGLNKENMVLFPMYGDASKHYETIKNTLLQQPGVLSVTAANANPLSVGNSAAGVNWEGKPEGVEIEFKHIWTDFDFVETMGIELAAGRTFSKALKTDSTNFLINEASVKAMGLENPIGKELDMWGMKGQIIGIIKDFHSGSIYKDIEPLIVRIDENHWRMMVRFGAGQTQEGIKALKKIQREYFPSYPFEYKFLDEEYNKLYQTETMVNKLVSYFAFLAIFISCLGLLGLATFNAQQRVKEIGIRKVLGATIPSILLLLSKEYLKLILIAFIIAIPVANYFLSEWLSAFAFKIDLEYWYFVVPGVLVILLALLAVSGQSLKAATTNPAKSLKSE